MKMYFSGVASETEAAMLQKAGVRFWLADLFDFVNLPSGAENERALDSGAYRAFKKGHAIDSRQYVAKAVELEISGRCSWAVAPDVIGDYVQTRKNWDIIESEGWYGDECGENKASIFPVYQWGAPFGELEFYAGVSPVVCIGGMVSLMREKNQKALTELMHICRDFKGLHILGLNWRKAIEELADYDGSCDTSKWLDAARYGHLIFKNSRTGHLSQAPARVLNLDLSREDRCVQSAKNMRKYLESPA